MTMPPADDIDRIMEVMVLAFDPAFGEAWNRRQVLDALTIGNCRYGLINAQGRPPANGEPAAGFFMVRGILDEAELLLIAVRPDMRNKGIGKLLLDLFAHDAANYGHTRLLLEMRSGNPAELLYRSYGFTQIGYRKEYYTSIDGSRLDALTFEKILAP